MMSGFISPQLLNETFVPSRRIPISFAEFNLALLPEFWEAEYEYIIE